MNDLVVAAQIANGGGNGLTASYSSDAYNWCLTSIPQSSQATPALGVLNGNLWTAFRGNSDTKIYAASLSDWGGNKFTSQSSQVAPAIASFGGKLWIAYIGESSSQVEVISSSDGTNWSASTVTGQSSKVAPAIAAIESVLWIAFIGESSNQVEVISSVDGTHWSKSTQTGQSSNVSPAIATYIDTLYIAYIGAASGNVEVISSSDGTNWSGKTLTGQSSKVAPALTAYLNTLYLAYVGEGSGQVEVITSINGTNWSDKNLTGQSSQIAPSLAMIPACTPPSGLGGFSQYVFSCPTESSDPSAPMTPLLDLVVEIKITDQIVVSSTSGLENGVTTPQPIGFQINGFSQKGDSTICWQQYGFQMNPGNNQLTSFAENWPVALNTNSKAPNVFNLSSANNVLLPNDFTIPTGWTIRFTFQYQGNLISGFDCSVKDGSGASLGNLNIGLIGQPLAAGGTIGSSDLAELVAFQVVLVAWANSQGATLTSGAGTITCSSSTVMTPGIPWPQDSDGDNGTAEEANSSYGLVPAQSSNSIAQLFGTK
jgi:hypothetical protein